MRRRKITIWESAPQWGEPDWMQREVLDRAYETLCERRLLEAFSDADIHHEVERRGTDGDRRVVGADLPTVAAILDDAFEFVCGASDEQLTDLVGDLV